MNELIQVGLKTYYISGPFHVGIYITNENITADGQKNYDVCLIDSGLDMVVAKVIDKLLEENHFNVSMIINTHYHADHTGGNDYFKKKYNCRIMSTKINAALMSNYDICPAIVWGAAPIEEILNNYFYATPCETTDIENEIIPEGISYFELPGHCISHICVKTDDDVIFLGDAVVGKNTLIKNPITYIYDIGTYLNSLEQLKIIKAGLYIPYHAEPVKNIKKLVEANYQSVIGNMDKIKMLCETPKSIDELMSSFYNNEKIKLSLYKYAVEGGVIKTYVSYLHNKGELSAKNIDNYIKWQTVKNKKALQ